jgi:transcriptional regulator with XRE-family HTH domain
MATRRSSQTKGTSITVLGDLIRKSRKEAGWTQKELGDKLEIPQATVSAWEAGKYFPDEERLPRIAQVLKISLDKLRDVYEIGEYEEGGFETAEAIYLQEQQRHIRDIGEANMEMFFLGPRTLPVISSDKVQDVWVKNLLAGVSYSILWYLDFMEPQDFRQIGPVLGRIDQKMKGGDTLPDLDQVQVEERLGSVGPHPGKINHYAITFSQENQEPNNRLASLITDLDELRDSELGGSNKFWPLVPVALPELLQYYLPFGSLVLYRDKRSSLIKAPLMSITLPDICRQPSLMNRSSDHDQIFCFVRDGRAGGLDSVIRLFLRRYEDALQKASSEKLAVHPRQN